MNCFKVERWWGVLLPTIAPFLYENGGPIVMVQVSRSATFYIHPLPCILRKKIKKKLKNSEVIF